MVELTFSLRSWFLKNHPDLVPLLLFGHTEEFTDEMNQEYLDWCGTEEGKRYLVGGDLYAKHMREINERRSTNGMA